MGIGDVVAAKIRGSIQTGKLSDTPYIPGARLLYTSSIDYKNSVRVVGVGGLRPGTKDLELIEKCIENNEDMRILNPLS